MELEVRHLRLLCTVADSGSLTKAAATLGTSQPGLSAQLRRIERFLGGELFTRDREGVTATALGQMVLAKASAVVPTVDELVQASMRAALAGHEQHRFRVGSIHSPLLSGVVEGLRTLHPGCDISTRHVNSTQVLLEDIAAGRLEVAAVGYNPGFEFPSHPGVVVSPIVNEPIFVLLPSCHRLADQSEVALSDLEGEDWVIGPPDDDRTREYFASVAGYRMRTPHEAAGRLLVELVRTNCGIALVQPTIDEVPGTAVRRLTGTPLRYQHAIAWHDSVPLEPHVSLLVALITQAYEAATPRNDAYAEWRRHNVAITA